ncbi:MAG: hypothetical protein A4E62_02239 [Syntrophorhabdus sp. PtaU1.Bin002]|nr:MAG: hypothetical protein A4E62_02239 [Syntrophorhabdus sp. PtaU1.Bin002]
MVIYVLAGPLRLFPSQAIHYLFDIGRQRVPFVLVHNNGEGDYKEVRFCGIGAVGGEVEVL